MENLTPEQRLRVWSYLIKDLEGSTRAMQRLHDQSPEDESINKILGLLDQLAHVAVDAWLGARSKASQARKLSGLQLENGKQQRPP